MSGLRRMPENQIAQQKIPGVEILQATWILPMFNKTQELAEYPGNDRKVVVDQAC